MDNTYIYLDGSYIYMWIIHIYMGGYMYIKYIRSDQISCSVVSDSL